MLCRQFGDGDKHNSISQAPSPNIAFGAVEGEYHRHSCISSQMPSGSISIPALPVGKAGSLEREASNTLCHDATFLLPSREGGKSKRCNGEETPLGSGR